MRVWGTEGYATVDFATRQTTVVRPSEKLRRGEVDLAGVDMTQPAAVKAHLFGNVLQVQQVQTEGREPLALELEDFIAAIRSGSSPRVTGEHGLRACAVADQILQSLNAHSWEETETGLTGPRLEPSAASAIPAPKFWRHPNGRGSEASTASRTGAGEGQSSS
jgi:predicted dehydrogenase